MVRGRPVKNARPMKTLLLAMAHALSGALDVGCGIGAVARSVAERVKDAHVTAIDSDQAFLDKAREMAEAGLTIVKRRTLWGEIWARVEPAA